MKKRIILVCASIIAAITLLTGCATLEREIKSTTSEFTGGLNRHVIAYSHDGEKLGEWTGKIDIQTNENGTKVLFDLNGKRIILYNAIVITEEM